MLPLPHAGAAASSRLIVAIWATAISLKVTGKLADEQTPYQHIEIYQTTRFGKLMMIDGCYMVTDRDNFLYHEMLSHHVLYTHLNPRKVVITGGGDCGTLNEVLKHPEVGNRPVPPPTPITTHQALCVFQTGGPYEITRIQTSTLAKARCSLAA